MPNAEHDEHSQSGVLGIVLELYSQVSWIYTSLAEWTRAFKHEGLYHVPCRPLGAPDHKQQWGQGTAVDVFSSASLTQYRCLPQFMDGSGVAQALQ